MGHVSSEKRIPQLDGIRGIAVSMVVLFHYSRFDDLSIFPNKAVQLLFSRGFSGVDLFFILSGFLIGGILLDNKIDRRFAHVFYYRRFLRIFPLYYALLVVAWFAAGRLPDGWWVYPLYLQNLTTAFGYPVTLDYPSSNMLFPTWSLAIEEHFYLLLPALIAMLSRRQLARAIAAFVLFAMVLRVSAFLTGWIQAENFAYFFTLCRVDELMLGVAAALAVRTPFVSSILDKSKTRLYIVLILCVALLPLIGNRGINLTVGLTVYAVLYLCVLFLAVCHPGSMVARITKLRILRWLGRRAYSIYLFHPTMLVLAKWLVPATSVSATYADRMIALWAVLLLAWFLWAFVEAPLIALGHRTKY